MPLPRFHQPAELQKKWYAYWQKNNFFKPKIQKGKPAYTVVMPPPNITGRLHMGHVLNLTVQDVLVRKARMEGKSTYWVPGLDHASIATEAKVVADLQEKGITKEDLDRDTFLQHAWAWKEKYGDIILTQMQELGASCDWTKTHFTLDPIPSQSVIKVFVKLHEKGYIYRGKRMINWDSKGKTALSDEEVIYKEVQGNLYHIAYQLVNQSKKIHIATTRPETILADTALAVHPDDIRYQHLIGKQAYIPLINRAIPIIADRYVDPKMGTGCLKVTPAHDPNDYEIGQRHHLPLIDIFNTDGTLNQQAGTYAGLDIKIARKKILQDLEAHGQLIKTEPHLHQVGFSERTKAIVEPRISTQWFVKTENLAKPALESVENGTIQFHPKKFINTYRSWMTDLKDWCISRQLWWGHRIPAYYLADGRYAVAETVEKALKKAKEITQNPNLSQSDLTQDPDVLDTWFSSWLWPISVLDGINNPENAEMQYYYPTSDLVTGTDIIFFWVARMIMAGYEFTQKPPFQNVYFTGIVRDKKRQKMSKSLGNSPEPLQLIEKYGADGVRAGILFSAPAGNDLLFDEKLCQQGAQFAHKLWNALRLIKNWNTTSTTPTKIEQTATAWFQARHQETLQTINTHFQKFQLSQALITLYKFIWEDFCSHYLEMIKPSQKNTISQQTYRATTDFFEEILKLLHPFMPFITEEIWQQLTPRTDKEALVITAWSKQKPFNHNILTQANTAFELIHQLRYAKTQNTAIHTLYLHSSAIPSWLQKFTPYLKKAIGAEQIVLQPKKQIASYSFLINGYEFSLAQNSIKTASTTSRNLQKELQSKKAFLATIQAKLKNPKFLEKAPQQLIEREKKKEQDTQQHIKSIQQLIISTPF